MKPIICVATALCFCISVLGQVDTKAPVKGAGDAPAAPDQGGVPAVRGTAPLSADKNVTSKKVPGPFRNIGVEEFDKLRQHKTNVVLDVRTPEEYAAGHIPGSVLLDFNAEDFDAQLAKLDKSKTYLVHCAAGGRSARACKKMEKLKFVELYNLEPGMTGWAKAGKPVEKK